MKNSKKNLPIPDSNNYILATEGKNLKNTNVPPKRIFIKSVLKYDKKRKKKEIRLSTLNNDYDENIENVKNDERPNRNDKSEENYGYNKNYRVDNNIDNAKSVKSSTGRSNKYMMEEKYNYYKDKVK